MSLISSWRIHHYFYRKKEQNRIFLPSHSSVFGHPSWIISQLDLYRMSSAYIWIWMSHTFLTVTNITLNWAIGMNCSYALWKCWQKDSINIFNVVPGILRRRAAMSNDFQTAWWLTLLCYEVKNKDGGNVFLWNHITIFRLFRDEIKWNIEVRLRLLTEERTVYFFWKRVFKDIKTWIYQSLYNGTIFW